MKQQTVVLLKGSDAHIYFGMKWIQHLKMKQTHKMKKKYLSV